jgi:hypothetical protein
MQTRLACLAVLAATTTGTTASANVIASDEVHPRSERRVDGRVGMLLGGSDVGDADGFSIGVSAAIGYRVGDVTLRGVFDHYRVGDGEAEVMVRRGRGTRVGGALRYSLASSYDPDRTRGGAAIDFWGEAGVGYEHVAWRAGGVLDRPSAELAVGFDVDAFGRRNDRTMRRRHVGYFMAFRTLIAQGPAMDGPLTCGGPCDRATRPSRTDVSMFFQFGLHWGR